MLTTLEIAESLKVSAKTVRNWIESGQLTAYRFGKDYRVKEEDFEEFKNGSKVTKDEQ